MSEHYMPGSWRHQDWCPTPSGHEGDCWAESNRVKGILPIPEGQPVVTIIDLDALLKQHRAGQHLPPIDPHCIDCQDILRHARANHHEHSWGGDVHATDEECVAAYIYYAQKMSES